MTKTSEDTALKILSLAAENVKRLKAVYIKPDGTLQVISGRNAQGKTSVLDAIWLALGGGSAARDTSKPIRDGEETAQVTVDLGDLVVTRTWLGEKSTLVVKDADGQKYSSPQSMLDSLVGRLSFDPLAFTRLSARDQVAALLDLVELDIDLDALARQRQTLFDQRTEVGRGVKALGEQPIDKTLPTEEVSWAEISNKYDKARDISRMHDNASAREAEAARSIQAIEERIAAAKKELVDAHHWLKNIGEEIAALPPIPDIADLKQQLEEAEGTNAKIRQNNGAIAVAAERKSLQADYDSLTKKIEELDGKRSAALAAAEFPVDGLGFTDDGVTYNKVPFSQASSAEQIRVSLAMAMALNPKLRVIRIMDGSLLDEESMTAIAEMATVHGYQVWIERVSDGSGVGIVIEDGQVV
jgi:phage shock protein A